MIPTDLLDRAEKLLNEYREMLELCKRLTFAHLKSGEHCVRDLAAIDA